MIPKIIHYCWFGGNPLPLVAKRCIATWKKFCPDYEIKRWDESNFDINCHPFVKAAYEAKAWAFVSDYARLKIIYDNGGIYLDTDIKMLKSFDSLLENQCFLGVQQHGLCIATGLGIGAERHSKVVRSMMEQYDGVIYSEENKRKMTCPNFNMAALKNIGYEYADEIVRLPGVTVYPPEYFDPITAGNYKNLLSDKSFSIHLGSMAWMSKKSRCNRNLICLIGVEKIEWIKDRIRTASKEYGGKNK